MGLPHLISITGAGPGDPELLTLKALDRIKKADVLLYDALQGNEILAYARADCKKVYTGKLCADGQDQKVRQEKIFRLFMLYADQGKKVVRLKAGDPMIFGRGAEELRFCKAQGLNYELIPGITAALAGSSAFAVPLTERHKSAMALFYTGRCANGSFNNLPAVAAVLQTGAPLMLYMGLANLPHLADKLILTGLEAHMPVQILSKVAQPGQKIRTTTLGEAGHFLATQQPETPAVIIIGYNAGII